MSKPHEGLQTECDANRKVAEYLLNKITSKDTVLSDDEKIESSSRIPAMISIITDAMDKKRVPNEEQEIRIKTLLGIAFKKGIKITTETNKITHVLDRWSKEGKLLVPSA
jgi:hypothetical protein